jgi:hypothetical protein
MNMRNMVKKSVIGFRMPDINGAKIRQSGGVATEIKETVSWAGPESSPMSLDS